MVQGQAGAMARARPVCQVVSNSRRSASGPTFNTTATNTSRDSPAAGSFRHFRRCTISVTFASGHRLLSRSTRDHSFAVAPLAMVVSAMTSTVATIASACPGTRRSSS